MVKFKNNSKPKSKIHDRFCPICKHNKNKYNSSSLGRHLRTVHGTKFQCEYREKKHSDKNSHKFCLEKEKHYLQLFIFYLNKPNTAELSKAPKLYSSNFFALFDDFKTCLLCKKLKIGYGHFSDVFYGLERSSFKEIAVKIPKKSDYLKSYQEEAELLKALENDEFYPKIYNYNLDYKVGHLELSLMGPSLYDLYEFSEGFDQLTILNIFENLLLKLKIISSKNIVHHDVKPENIVLGIFENSALINPDELYFIDFGCSINFNKFQESLNDKKN